MRGRRARRAKDPTVEAASAEREGRPALLCLARAAHLGNSPTTATSRAPSARWLARSFFPSPNIHASSVYCDDGTDLPANRPSARTYPRYAAARASLFSALDSCRHRRSCTEPDPRGFSPGPASSVLYHAECSAHLWCRFERWVFRPCLRHVPSLPVGNPQQNSGAQLPAKRSGHGGQTTALSAPSHMPRPGRLLNKEDSRPRKAGNSRPGALF